MAAEGSRPIVHIDVWSDLACPWCYVGKKRLDKAIEDLRDEVTCEVRWYPYMIDTATNPDGEEYLAYNRRRWGSDGWTQSLRASGRKSGAMFRDWQWWPNTLKAHELCWLAEREGKGSQAQEALFEATYEKGENISDLNVLIRIGQELQLPDVEQCLKEGRGRAEVVAADRSAKAKGISGVPKFVVRSPGTSQSFVVEGADTVDTFSRAISQACAAA